jgi:hypothetical protein
MKTWKQGGCHCGEVRFSVRATFESALFCNCSICRMSGFLHLIVAKEDFRLEKGEQSLVCYQFGSKIAKHFFCKICGGKSFYIPRSHPDGYSVNLRTVNDLNIEAVRIEQFDGQNWDANIDKIT